MTLDLEAIKARCEAATRGPWKVAEPGYRVAVDDGTGFLVASTFMAPSSRDLPDARFIAHARTDVPALVAEVERLRQLRHVVATLARALARDHQGVLQNYRVDL